MILNNSSVTSTIRSYQEEGFIRPFSSNYSVEQIKALRRGEFPEDPHIDALVKFVKTLVTTRNTLPEETVSRFLAAGFSDRQVVEVISAVSAILFTNMVNRVNDTVVDFPKVN